MTAAPKPPTLQFLGATGTVTGSRFLLDTDGRRVMVDCGLFQGLKADRLRNWDPFPVDPATIDELIITHAHIDHSGYIPRLVRLGFDGRVICSPESAALIGILLRDSGRLQEEQAAYANRTGATKHDPALPLYTEEDAQAACALLSPVPMGEPFPLGERVECVLDPAGHILGSSTVGLSLTDGAGGVTRVRFSGDLGRPRHPLLLPPSPVGAADVIVVESTYGDRSHPDEDGELGRFAEVIRDTAARGGTVVIPAFAVDRTEVVLHALETLETAGEIPDLPIFVDSPMALSVLDVYRKAIESESPQLRPGLRALAAFDRDRITECRSTEESKRLAELTYPSIIISASGMASGGRVLHHLARLLPDRRNSVVLTGFQAEGTRGDRLQRGERAVKIFGRYVPVRADVEVLDGFSVHADADELIAWLRTAEAEPECCYVVHGSASASAALARRISSELDWVAVAPKPFEKVIV
jgi:metallo-beta-lactamase family protein